MDDYSALAQRVAVTVGDVRGCLVLSRDGLVLGAYPEDESAIRPAWLKFATIGEPRKSFVEFADQVWAYVHRGPYAAFVVAGASIRPGVLIDQMEQALLTAEESRARRDHVRLPDATAAPSGKPRTSLHPAERGQPVAERIAAAAERSRSSRDGADAGGDGDDDAGRSGAGRNDVGRVAAGRRAEGPPEPAGTRAGRNAPEDGGSFDGSAGSEAPGATEPEPELPPVAKPARMPSDDEGEIDRVLLAKEFSGLLQLDEPGRDAES